MLFISAVQNALTSPRTQQSKCKQELPQQIDGNQLSKLLQLEALFHERLYSLVHVQQMLEIYSYLVEQFDIKQQTLKDYFLEKMQYLLSRSETFLLMENEDNPIINRLTTAFNETNFDQVKFEEETRFNRPFLQQQSDSNSKMRFSVFKKHQAKEMEICLQIQDKKQNQKTDVNTLLQEYDEISKEYDELIKKQFQDQNNVINQRMAQRKRSQQQGKIKHSNSSENIRPSIKVNPFNVNTALSKWKQISEIQASVQYIRQSINKLKR